MAMTDAPANPTDIVICRLLAAGPLPTRDLAERLGIPERTARHRLVRLRQAAVVVSGPDGLHRLAAPVPAAPIAGGLPAPAAPAGDLAAPVLAAPIAGGLPSRGRTATTAFIAGGLPARDSPAMGLAAPVMAPDDPDPDGASPRQGGRWGPGAILAAVAVGLVVVGGIAIAVAIRRVSPPSPPPAPAPARPAGFGYPGDPWGGRPW
jgi:hypothetical protein